MKRPTESEIYEQAFEFVSKCESFRKTDVYQVYLPYHHYRVCEGYDTMYSHPRLPSRLEVLIGYHMLSHYRQWGSLSICLDDRTFWEWLTRKPSEKAQWIQALDAAAALLR